MSESAAKASRRDVRRSLGPQGLAVVHEAQSNIGKVANSVQNAHSRIDHLSAKLDDRWLATAAAHKSIDERIFDFQTKGFGARMRWLVFGR